MTRSADTRRTGLGPATPWALLDRGEYAVRLGRGVCGWASGITPGAVTVVLTTAGLYHNLAPNTRVMCSQYCYAVETTSDNCIFEFGYTDQPNGAGTFYPMGPHKHVYTGAANQGRTAYDQPMDPPIVFRYSAGARCVTFRVTANDAGCDITVGWHGWWEPTD